MKKTAAILLTVFNRKEKTLECLDCLFKQNLPRNYNFDVYLTDDGCSDGTPEAVKEKFPTVNIIKGSGNLFWNRGMYTSWQAASSSADYDYYFWLNDDTMLYEDSFAALISCAQETKDRSIICGATCAIKDGKVTYSGQRLDSSRTLPPSGKLQECDIINGNFVLIPKIIFKTIGNLDWTFRHAIGDFDYGLRAKNAGFQSYIAPEYVGTCEQNPTRPKWCLKTTPLMKRFNILYSPLGYAEPIPFFIYEKRHFGLGLAIKHFLSINLKALAPQLWD